jgi:hypothetical protein
MTSVRKRKKQAARHGLSLPQLELLELVEEMLEAQRWLQVLGFANQFMLTEKLAVTAAERDRVLEAATRAVDKDARLASWRQRLARVKAALAAAEAGRRQEAEAAD